MADGYERELEVARRAAREAAAAIRHHYETGTEVWEKGEDDPLTRADLDADQCIARHLAEAFPADALLSEERLGEPKTRSRGRLWIVDPMDGTKEFTRRIPEFGVSIALVVDGEPVVGVVHNPPADVAVWARRGGGCFRDGERVRVSSVRDLADAVLVASRSELSRDLFASHRDWFREIRPVGSIAWKLACVACGDGDLNVSLAPKNEWDVAAGDLLVREAGGVYAGADGRARRYGQADTGIPAHQAAGPAVLVERYFERERARA